MSFRLTQRLRQTSFKSKAMEDAQAGNESQSGGINEHYGAGDVKPALTRAESVALLERRLSRRGTVNLSRRKSRPTSGSSHRSSSAKPVVEVEEDKPTSQTALRLRALAHAVRAQHSLGIQKPAQRKYLLQASEIGTEETDVSVDILMAGIQTKLKEDVANVGNYQFTRRKSVNNMDLALDQVDSGSPKSKVRFSKGGSNNVQPGSTSGSSPSKKPALRSSTKSTTMKRGSLDKKPIQRVNTIRGDLTAFLNVYDAKPRKSETNLDRLQNMNARLTCARSLYKLSCQSGSELAIIGGGAIAQIADFSDVEDAKILRYAAAVLVNVTTDSSVLEDFTSKDGVSSLLELCWAPQMDVKIACTTALCRLSLSRARAAVLVRSRAITELMSLLTIPNVPLQQLVVSCIMNLIFYGHTFPDRVFLGDPQAVQSPLGLISVISQQSVSSATSQFAIEVLFNLSLYRSSCLGALRGGGAEILHTLVTHLCRIIDGSTGGSSSRYLLALGSNAPSWTADMPTCMKLLRLAADTLANFSSFVDYHSLMGSHGLKSLHLLLFGALRDVGNYNPSVASEERFRSTSVPCSRALANFSSNADLQRQNFPQDLIHLTTKLALMDHQRYCSSPADARALMRNAVRTLSNLSFEISCASAFMEVPQVLLLLHTITILPPVFDGGMGSRVRSNTVSEVHPSQENLEENRITSVCEITETPSDDSFGGVVGNIALGSLSAPAPVWYLLSSRYSHVTSFPWTTEMSEDIKEDALVAILNLAQLSTYANELLRTLDGKLLAAAAEDAGHSRRLRYVYSSVLCNLLFDSYMQQLVYGDQVARALVNGFSFFEDTPVSESVLDTSTTSSLSPSREKTHFQGLNLAFDDDRERFLASIYLIANELMDTSNIELVVSLVLPCMKAFITSATTIPVHAPPSHPQRIKLQQQLPIVCYASASLFALTRSATQRRDSQKNLVYSEETESTLIEICGLPSAPGLNSSGDPTTASSSSRGGVTQAFCAATLYHLCASTPVNKRVIQGLIDCCNANEETQSLLACSAAFAIISFTAEGCQQLVQCGNLARALNRLGRTSQVECQQYAAIAACNVSTVRCIWSSAELKDFIVVALLRANSIQAKQIHAKTLSNLLSHSDSRPKVVEDGVLYALMKLSQVMLSGASSTTANPPPGDRRSSATTDSTAAPLMPSSTDEVFSIGLRALFNLSCDHKYHQKLISNGVMAYLSAAIECKRAPSSGNTTSFSQVASNPTVLSFLFGNRSIRQAPTPAQQCLAGHLSTESRRFALAIICNLASYEENHKDLMRAQVAETIRNYTDADIESRASATMALRNLSCRQPWVEMLCERKTLQLLITSTECEHPVVRQFAIEALANCSLVTDSLHLFAELRVPRSVLALLEVTANALPSGSTPSVSVSWELSAEQNDDPEALGQILEEREPTSKSTYMAALRCLFNIAHDDALALALMEENIVLRILPLLEYRGLGEDVHACELAASLTHTLAGKQRCAEALLRQRTVSLCALLHRRHAKCSVIARECVRILMLLSTYQHIQLQLCETQAVHVVVSICGGGPGPATGQSAARNLRLRECGAVTIRNLTLCVTEHLALFYEKHDDGDGTLQEVGSSSSGHQRAPDVPTAQNDEDDTDTADTDDKNSSISLMLERHMLHGIKYFQGEIVSGQASDRILLEASAAIANLSTMKVFRVAMVRLGVIQTLLHLMAQPQPKAQRMTLSSPSLAPTSPVRLRNTYRNTLLGRICAATLHRLVVEEGAAADARSQLVPSLLSVLRQTDEELQQVRYECEKISLFTPSTFDEMSGVMTPPTSHGPRRFTHVHILPPRASELIQHGLATIGSPSEADAVASPSNERRRQFGSLTTLVSPGAGMTTHCVRQTYREQKWMAYVLKTILSSQSMIPQLEKKQMRTLGLPKLCFQDLTPPVELAPIPAPSSGNTSSRSSTSVPSSDPEPMPASDAPPAGYLLPVNMEKHVIRNVNGVDEIVPVSVAEATSPRPRSATATTRPIISSLNARASSASPNRSQPERDGVADHTQKFNRQMRLLRRNDRRDVSLPPV